MNAGSTRRLLVLGACLVAALLLQVTVLPPFAWSVGPVDVVPDVVLLVVVATALLTDARTGTLTGFAAGLLLDLAPPADHVAGRWALALLVVGYVVGRLAHDDETGRGDVARADRVPWGLLVVAAAGGAFIGTTVYALTGLVLGDTDAAVGSLMGAVLVATVQDAVAALVVVPAVRLALLGRAGARGGSGPRLAGPRGTMGPVERRWARVG